MTDILIIGGGIAGVSAAARLAPHARVTVLETETQLAYHASGRSAAVFLEFYGNAVVRALNAASAEYLHQANGGVTKPRDFFLLAKPEQEESYHRQAPELGVERISFDAAHARVPILRPETCAFVGHCHAFDVDTDLLIQNFRREALRHGAEFQTGALVTALTRTEGRWHAETPKGRFSCDVVINAAGAWADQVAVMAGLAPLGLQAYRRSMARIPAPGGHDLRDWPFMDGVDDGWYAKPDAGSLVVSPQEEDPAEPHDAWADDMVLAEGLARYEEMVTEPVTRLEANWAGLRTFAPDRALVIGAAPGAHGVFWLAGQGGYGFQTCAAASQLVADLVLGRTPDLPPEIVKALDPRRFAPAA